MAYCTECGMKLLDKSVCCPRCRAPVPGKKQPTKAVARPVKKPTKKQYQAPTTQEVLARDGAQRREMGETLIRITKHGGACLLCKPFEGKVLIDDVFSGGTILNSYKKYDKVPMKYRAHVALLSQAMREGLFHEGCRHGCSTYYI